MKHTSLCTCLGALAALFLTSASSWAVAADAYRWVDTPGESLELRQGDRAVVRYMYTPIDESSTEARDKTFKPYLHVFSPDGERLLTKGPGGLFPHHRGIYFGFNQISYGDGLKCDTWHCRGKAHQLHREVVSKSTDEKGGRLEVLIEWNGQKGETFALERRVMEITETDQGTIVDFAATLEAEGEEPIKLDGDPQHAGVQFRAAQQVADQSQKKTYYLRPDGKGEEGKTRNWDHKKPKNPNNKQSVDLPWLTLNFELDDQRYSVQRISHPANPKPERFSEREYGRFGSYFVTAVTKEKPLEVQYRFVVKEGEMTLDEAKQNAEDYTR